MRYLGDFRRGTTLDCKFYTHDGTGTPITLAGSPAVSIYKGNDTTQSTAGVTLTVGFDSVTGLHNLRIVTTDSFYEPGADYQAVLTAGTVDGISVVGYVVASFSIENRFRGEVSTGTAQGGAAQAITLATTESSTDDALLGDCLLVLSGTGAGQWRQIVTYTGATRVAGVDRAWAIAPDNTSVYLRFPGSLPLTSEELETELTDPVLTVLGTPTDTDLATDIANVLGQASDINDNVNTVKAKTDQLTFSAAGFVDANVMEVNDNGGLTGDGDATPVEKA